MAAVVGHAKGLMKSGAVASFGLLTGAAMMYGRAALDKVVKPTRPVANFSVGQIEGLTVTLQNQAAGDSGWWDYGDGTALEPFVSDKPATHTYAKSGTFSVKLLVRNFLMEENDRTVPVEVAASATAAPNLLPKVTLSVEPVGKAVAPATFRVRGEVQNVEHAFLDLGDRVEVTEPGAFDKYIVIDKPSQFPIQLIGHSGKQAIKQSAAVDVKGDRAGTLSAVVRTVDSGTRTQKDTWQETVAVPAVKGQKGFEKIVPVRPGFTVTAASAAAAAPKGVKGLSVTPTPDKRGVKVTGEWADNAAEAMVSVTVTGEKAVPVSFPHTTGASFDGQTGVVVPLPPQRRDMAGLTRKVVVELRAADGNGRPQVLATCPDLKGKWEQPTSDGRVIRAELVGDQVRVTLGR